MDVNSPVIRRVHTQIGLPVAAYDWARKGLDLRKQDEGVWGL
jgi:hypothetical protein